MIFSSPDFDGHEQVVAFFDAEAGLKGFIAIHSTALGPAFGGCRMWDYPDEAAAVEDALRLSRGMSYKNAIAGLAYGGGKAVIIGDPRADKTPSLFRAFGQAVERLAGRYITAEDVGVSVEDMRAAADVTEWVAGIPQEEGYRGGDPSPVTARGVLSGIRSAVRSRLGRDDLEGLTIAVQGLGSVGYNLCRLLHEAGAWLKVADINADNVARARAEFGADVVAPEAFLAVEADVLAPCALGGILNEASIARIKAPVIAGAANNQLAREEDGARLAARGILYAPDYVINAGGIISVAAERDPTATKEGVMARVDQIGARLDEIFTRSQKSGDPPHRVADEMAREIIAGVSDDGAA